MHNLDDIEKLAHDVRKMFEVILRNSIGTSATKGACLHAAILLSTTLSKFAGARTQICGGGPPTDGGLLDKAGNCQGHYWVEGVSESGLEFIADITADQFDYPKVVVLPVLEGRERYHCGNPDLIAEHVRAELEACSLEASGRG